MHGRLLLPLAALLALLPACGDTPPPLPPPPPPVVPTMGALFDPAMTGAVAGSVRWRGEIPAVPPLRSVEAPLMLVAGATAHDWPNPNAPRVDPATRGLSSVVVFLRGVDPAKSRPWHHPALQVELRDQRFNVAGVGVVRAGDAVTLVSRDSRLHVVQARGDAFFSLTLPHADQPRSRRLTSTGVVELLSGSGLHWMRAYLHVCDHPYFARPDESGEFRLEQVPAGEYELVAWHPSWRVAAVERNPDLGRVQQVRFASPHEVVKRVRIKPGATSQVEMAFESP